MKYLIIILLFIPLIAFTQSKDTSINGKIYKLQSVNVTKNNEKHQYYTLGTYNKFIKLIGRMDFVMN